MTVETKSELINVDSTINITSGFTKFPSFNISAPLSIPNYSALNVNSSFDFRGNTPDQAENLTFDGESSQLNLSDFVGNNNSDDYFKFSLNKRANFWLSLNGLSADANVAILNSNTESNSPIKDSHNLDIQPEYINRILEPGEYYIRVFLGTSGTQTNYKLDLKKVNLSGDINNKQLYEQFGREKDEPDISYLNGANFYRYNTSGRTYDGIESNKNTIVVIHGRGDSSEGRNIKLLSMTAASINESKNYQILALDWQKPAEDKDTPPYFAARNITPVAEWAKNTLTYLGIDSQQITLIGHSLGSYVSDEIGRFFGKVQSLIALDPAYPADTYDINGNEPGNQQPKPFKEVANNSLAFVVSDEYGLLGGSAAGDNNRATTANNSFIIRFNIYQTNQANQANNDKNTFYHNSVVDVYRYLISNYQPPSLQQNKYDNDGKNDSWFWKKRHEGVITATWENNDWVIKDSQKDFQFVKGSEQISWI
ncbi:MAG: hypothetical protein HC908_13685 [Calothrix sp. SM1_7_51]|nr:hypothetical protein [Calothrix sp. SM1_7_51]